MQGFTRKINFVPHLGVLFRISRCCGLTHFTLDPDTMKFRHSTNLYNISSLLLKTARLLNGFLACLFFVVIIVEYMCDYYQLDFETMNVHESVIIVSKIHWYYISTFLISNGHLLSRHLIIPTLNELVKISMELGRLTNGDMYFPSSFQVWLNLKVFLSLLRVVRDMSERIFLMFTGDMSAPVAVILLEFAFWTHLYANLVLNCFYLKMNEFLAAVGSVEAKYVHRLLSLSIRIHRLKSTLNKIYSPFFLSMILSFCNDIGSFLGLLRFILFVAKYPQAYHPFAWIKHMIWGLSKAFWASYDLFLIGYLADMLTTSAEDFYRNIFLLFSMNRKLKVALDFELLLLEDLIEDVSTRGLCFKKIDRSSAFSAFTNVVLTYTIVGLQLSLPRLDNIKTVFLDSTMSSG